MGKKSRSSTAAAASNDTAETTSQTVEDPALLSNVLESMETRSRENRVEMERLLEEKLEEKLGQLKEELKQELAKASLATATQQQQESGWNTGNHWLEGMAFGAVLTFVWLKWIASSTR